MPEFQTFSVTCDKGEWKIEDTFTARNLISGPLTIEFFQSRVKKLNSDLLAISKDEQSLTTSGHVLMLSSIVVGIIVGLLVAAKSISMNKTTAILFFAVVLIFFIVGGVMFGLAASSSQKKVDRTKEILAELSAEDRAVGVNWVYKLGQHEAEPWIEVQIWCRLPASQSGIGQQNENQQRRHLVDQTGFGQKDMDEHAQIIRGQFSNLR
ncbi:hypothetical protein BJ742DRAFT_843019 [Cladochytrium replicatum]|nr:hypothetical protein BJ742DRAFT_843019 [Cladochytrium replicatum]